MTNNYDNGKFTAETVDLIKKALGHFFGEGFLESVIRVSHTNLEDELECIQSSLVKLYGENYPSLLARIVKIYLDNTGIKNNPLFSRLTVDNPAYKKAPPDKKTEAALKQIVADCDIQWGASKITVIIRDCPHHNPNYTQHPRLCPVSLFLLVLFETFEGKEILTAKRNVKDNGVKDDESCVIEYYYST